MKKIALLTMTLVAVLGTVSGQTISSQIFLEQTVMGLQKGYGIRYQTAKGLGVGVVFQSNGKLTTELGGDSYPFYGIETVIPITKCGNIRFSFSPKIGFVSENYVVAIPQVETEIKVTNFLAVGITTGIRGGEPSAGTKMLIHF